MSEYSSETNFDVNLDDPVARAKQIAAKITLNSQPSSTLLQPPYFSQDGSPPQRGLKRPPSEENMNGVADMGEDGGQSMGQPPHLLIAQQKARELAAALSMSNPAAAPGGVPGGDRPPGAPSGMVSEEYKVPDRMVGLIIGKGGEQITKLQATSGCKIQINQVSTGPERQCTLTGSPDAVAKAKALLQEVINEKTTSGLNAGGGGGGMGGGGVMVGNGGGASTPAAVEILVPGNKVGLVIGKGGETIKQLQEREGVKMVMVQDSNVASNQPKPLRITGDPQKCQRVKEIVQELINDDKANGGGGGGGGGAGLNWRGGGGGGGGFGGGGYGGGGSKGAVDIPVPRACVGVVIGKNGDMIKKIQQESDARIQFKQDDQGTSPERLCTISGTSDSIQMATSIIQDLIAQAKARDGGRGPGRGGGGAGGNSWMGGGSGQMNGSGGEVQFPVPADKCGLVIGKGGETIREIKNMSGAHVELSRAPPPNPSEKFFIIRGNAEQIDNAQRMISEKIGLATSPMSGGAAGQGGPQGGMGGTAPGMWGSQGQSAPAPAAAAGGWGNNQAAMGAAAPGGQWGGPAANGTPGQMNNGQWGAQQTNGQWGQQQANGQWPGGQQTSNPAEPATMNAQAGATPGAGGQPDYSLAWAEYYRSQGNHYYAELIMQQHAQNLQRMQQQTPNAGGDPQAAAPPQPPTTNSPQAQGGATPAQAPQGWGQQPQGGVPATPQGWGQAAPAAAAPQGWQHWGQWPNQQGQ